MGVMMQAFYWNCPDIEKRAAQWWTYLNGEMPKLSAAGFTALMAPSGEQGCQ